MLIREKNKKFGGCCIDCMHCIQNIHYAFKLYIAFINLILDAKTKYEKILNCNYSNVKNV